MSVRGVLRGGRRSILGGGRAERARQAARGFRLGDAVRGEMSGGTPVVIVQQSAQPLAALDLAGCPADAAANVAFGSAEGAAVSAQTISDAAATLAAITAAADAALTDIESDAGAIDDYLDG